MRTRIKSKGTRPPTKEEKWMTEEERRCNRLFKIAMCGIASFYYDSRAALKLLRRFVALSPSKVAARDAIILRSKLELTTFEIRKKKGLPLREQRIETLERAFFGPPAIIARKKTVGSAKMDRQYYGRGRN